ncbi:MAG TPA: hypothetical protein EYP30_07215 [Archaeoglobaceae archaeon]|nr:hypothetical protein [Archaeoglobaceae archaeon]
MSLCARCKGSLLCGRIKCPLLEKFRFLTPFSDVEGQIEKPTPPSVFVGRMGYPKINAGPLLTMSSFPEPEFADSPWLWESTIEDVIKIRSSLLRGMKRLDIKSEDRYLIELQETAASTKHIEVETEVKKIIKRPVFDDVMQPMGISARIEGFEVVENPKIPGRVEKVYYDDLNAVKALKYLFDHGFNTYYLQRIFSVGMLGEKKKRKLVPTRWSITAVHDILGEEMKKEISDFNTLDEYLLFSFEHFGNHFEIIFSPGNYSFELVEIWTKKSFWNPESTWIGYDREDIMKRKDYSVLGGGYYASRLPVLEYMIEKRRKASVTVIREIKPEYYAPLGVWVVEEGVRKALNNQPEKSNSFENLIAKSSFSIKIPAEKWIHVLKSGYQSSLSEFIR